MLQPATAPADPVILGSWARNALGGFALSRSGAQTEGYAAWPSSNTALFVPFFIRYPFTAVKMLTNNGTTSGNFDIGIYDSAGTRLVSKGSTAQSGTSTLQEVDITDTALAQGRYYLALVMDNTTGQMARLTTGDVTTATLLGVRSLGSAFPLPSDASAWVITTQSYVPFIAMSRRTLV